MPNMAMWMGAWRVTVEQTSAGNRKSAMKAGVRNQSYEPQVMGSVLSAPVAFREGESCGARSLLLEAILVIWPSRKGPLFGSMISRILWNKRGHTSRTARTSPIAPKQGDGGITTSSDLALLGAIESMIKLLR
ncbi:hypothetical protein C1H46_001146 [Malus baccata]|uniref:Uncharacterized protein n=1 Tax=Malus baccata TaxID=106549 RepID=A0A540NQN8_MALBA|nr:hypothetical protein C1H46_001146 [Malus baccata]